QLALGIRELPLELLPFLQQRLDALDDIVGLGSQRRGQHAHARILLRQVLACTLRRQRLDTADARGTRALGSELDEADVARALHVRAAAQLDRPGLVRFALTRTLRRTLAGLADAHRDDAHFLAVFFAEQGARPRLPRVLECHQSGLDGCVLQHV